MSEWRRLLASSFASEVLYDEGVEVARNACVAGASIAAGVIAAAAWYDNPLTGLPALRACMTRLSGLPPDVDAWRAVFARAAHPETEDPHWSPGFGFVSPEQASAILDVCRALVAAERDTCRSSSFLLEHERAITKVSGPLNQAGLAALIFVDHAIDAEEAERSFLLWRLEPAISAAQGARRRGVAAFPFFTEQYVYEGARPPPKTLDLEELMRQVGLV